MIRWSASSLKLGMDCSLASYYEKVLGLQPTHTLGHLAAGTFLHRRIESFYNKKGKNIGKPVYHSGESFAKASYGLWKHKIIATGEMDHKRIDWRNDKEKYILANQIYDSCIAVYPRYASDEPPLLKERRIKFSFNHRLYSGQIDEIRKGGILRDHKHSDLDETLPWNLVRFAADIQPTIYLLWYTLKAHRSLKFRKFMGISDEDETKLETNPLYLMDRTPFQYHDLKNGTLKEVRRTREDIQKLEAIVDEMNYKIENRKITANTSHCKNCKFNDRCSNLIEKVLQPDFLVIKQMELFDPDPELEEINTYGMPEVLKTKRQVQHRLKFGK